VPVGVRERLVWHLHHEDVTEPTAVPPGPVAVPQEYERELLKTLHLVLESTSDVLAEMSNRHGWSPTSGSPAAAELVADERGPGGPWGEEPVSTALSFASLSMFATMDHLNSMAALIDERAVATLLGLQTIARSAVEAASQAWWMLEPDIGPRVRVGRSFRLRQRSTDDAARVLREMGAPAEAIAATRTRRQEVLDQAAACGIRVQRRKEDRVPIAIEVKMPGKAELVSEILDDSNFSIGKGYYSFLAGISHGDPWALHQFFDFEESGSPLSYFGLPSLKFGMLHTIVFLTVMPALSAGDRLVALYGWEEDQWSDHTVRTKQRLVEVDPRDRLRPTAPH
jgi:hypothetical protein